jgi:hypothetical protein
MTALFLFIGWSITSVIVNGKIFDPIRNYFLVKNPFIGNLISCVQCTSVWLGALIFWPLLAVGEVSHISEHHWISYLVYPFLQSGSAVMLESFVIYLVKGASRNN